MSSPKSNKVSETVTLPPVDVYAGRGAYMKVCKAKGIQPKLARREYQAAFRKHEKAIRQKIAIASLSTYRERVRKDGKRGISVFGVIG